MATRFDTVKDATKLALQHRKAIKEGDFTPFIPALAFAIAKDGLLDGISAIPVLGLISEALGMFIAVYLFVFLWGRGKWKVRLVIFFLSLFDAIPVVSLLPFSTICVLYAYHQAKKKAIKAKKELTKLGGTLSNAERIREYQKRYAAEPALVRQDVEQDEQQAMQQPAQSRVSAAADFVPVVGSVKMVMEGVRGKQSGGRELRGMERARYGVTGVGMLAADLTGVGEVARLGKVGMVAARSGERKAAAGAARAAAREGVLLRERGEERSRMQNSYRSAHNVV